MVVVSLALAVILSAPTAPDPSGLVRELNAAPRDRREAAETALEKLGRAAVPALRAGRESRNPDVRARSAAVLARIDATWLTRPTPILIDIRDEPLADAIEAINARSGLSLGLSFEKDPSWGRARLTCRASEPLTFWAAIDALCAAGHVHCQPGQAASTGPGEPAFLLYPGDAAAPDLISDSGPFRVQLASIHFQSDLPLARVRPLGEGRTSAVRQFYLQVIVAADPRLTIAQTGPARILQAEDDRGNALAMPPGSFGVEHSSGYLGLNASPSLQVRVDLRRPDPSAQQIRSLRGVVPLAVSARKPDPVTVDLSAAPGRTFQDDWAAFTIDAVHPLSSGHQAAIEITARSNRVDSDRESPRPRPEITSRQVEILDARGVSLPWFPTRTTYEGDTTRYTLTLTTEGKAVPTSIRFHEIGHATTDVPFEFHAVAMP